MTAHRRACCAQAAHPVAGRRRCQSHVPAATTSQHWPRSPERQPQPVGTIGPRRPPPPPARADPQNRLVPSLLASSPASSLNHNPRLKGIPSDSVSCGKTLASAQTHGVPLVTNAGENVKGVLRGTTTAPGQALEKDGRL